MGYDLQRLLRSRIVGTGFASIVLGLASLALLSAGAPAQGTAARLQLIASDDLSSSGLDGQTKPRGQNGEVAILGNTAFVAGGSLYHGARATAGRICTDFGGVKNVDLSDPANPVKRAPIDVNDPAGVGAPWLAANPRRNQQFRNVSVTAIAVDTLSSANFNSSTLGNPVTDVLAIGGARCEPNFFAGGRIDLVDVDDPANPVLLSSYALPGGLGTLEDVQIFERGSKVFALATIPFNRSQGTRGDLRLVDITNPQSPVEIMAGEFPALPPGGPDPISSRNGCQTFLGGKAVAPTPDGSAAFLSFYDGTTNFSPGGTTEAVFKLGLSPPIEGTGVTSMLGSWGYIPGDPALEGTGADNDVEGNAADLEAFPGAQGSNRVMVSEDDLDPAFTTLQLQSPATAASTWRACESNVSKKLYQLPGQQLTDDIAYLGRGCPSSKLTGSTNTADEAYTEDPNGKIALLEGGPSPFDGCGQYERYKRAIDAGAVAVMSTVGENLLNSTSNGPSGGIPDQPVMTITQDAYRRMQLVPNPLPASTVFGAGTTTGAWKRTTTTNVTTPTNAYPGRASGDRARFRSQADATDRVARGEVNDLNPGGVCGAAPTCRFTVSAGQQYRAGAFMQVESWTAGTFRTAVVWYGSGGAPLSESLIASRTGGVSGRSLETQTVTAPPNAVTASVKFEWTSPGNDAAGVGFADNFFVVPAGLSGTLRDAQGQWGAQRILDFTNPNPADNIATYRSPRSRLWPPPGNGIYAPRAAKIVGSRAFTTWLSDGLRVLDVSNPASPREIAAFVPPAAPDPSPQAGAGSTATPPRTDSPSQELRRGPSWPTVPLVTGVDVLRRNGQSTHVVISDINSGLHVLCIDQACPAQAPGPREPSYPQPYIQPATPFADCPTSIANVIRGTIAGDLLNGTPGADRIFAGTGNDRVDGRAGNDCIDLGPGTDRGQGSSGRDLIVGGLGRDRLAGSTGNDRLRGGSSADRLVGGFGNDRLHGQSGSDRVNGERGRDRINGGSSNDRIAGGSSGDRIAGDQGNDRVNGGSGNDRVKGNSGRDRLKGSSGRDRISGGSGNDRIAARDGRRDRINCGSGRDRVTADRIDRVARNCERVRRR